ncbi:ribosomal-protein-alanine N-acetyltransferase [Endozoicomonas sp. (ex Bugula neritina AB1)]|nr:ribosomal-protein-alanine N-acetyltransferase [Endozoicomonas sp. (ex Bugula neritina AB1)]
MTTTPLSFRAMIEDDLDQVCSIEQQASSHPWKASHFADSLRSGYQCIIAEENNEIVGYAVLMLVVDEAHLLILTVAREHQKKGNGQKILEHLTALASDKECSTLLLEVRESNQTAFNLYLNSGLCEIGQRRNYYADTGEDAIIMALDLQYY